MKATKFLVITIMACCAGPFVAHADDEGEGQILAVLANAKWQEECGTCHLAYPPALLPARSWRKLMGGLDKHFGQDASLNDAERKEITDFLVTHSADQSKDPRAAKILKSIPKNAEPLRITQTGWFKREHAEVAAATWKRKSIGSPANCAACHKNAEKASFSEREIAIPK